MATADVQRVEVRLYDVSRGLASRLSGPILGHQIDGLYHATTVLNGVEYSYGPSLTRSFPGQNIMLRGTPARIIDVGTTSLGPAIVDELMRTLETRYNADTYDVVFNNCTTFSNELVEALTGQQLPDYVLNQLQDIISTPLGDGLLRVLSGEAPPADFMATHGELLHDIMRNLFGGSHGGHGSFGFGQNTSDGPAAAGGGGNTGGSAAAADSNNAAGGGPFPFFGSAFPFFGGAGGPWMRRSGGFWGSGNGGGGCGAGAGCGGGGFRGRCGGCWAGQGCQEAQTEADADASGSGPKQVPMTTNPATAPTNDDPKGKRPAAATAAAADDDDAIPTAPAAPAVDGAADSDAAAAALMGDLTVEPAAAADAAMEVAAVEVFCGGANVGTGDAQ